MSSKPADYSIRAIERVMQILKCFDHQTPKLTYLQIAELTKIPPTTVFKHLQILVRENYLEQNGTEGTYQVGREAFRLGNLFLSERRVIDIASPLLKILADRIGTTVSIGILDGWCSLTLMAKESDTPFRLSGHVGGRWPLQRSALGKALLLDASYSELVDILPPQPWPQATPKSITHLDQLQEQLELFRVQGYTYDDEESVNGVCCIGYPIRNHEGEIIASISTSAVKAALTRSIDEIGGVVRETAERISSDLGYR